MECFAMDAAAPPSADDENAYIVIDRDDEESFLVEVIAERLAPEHELWVSQDGDDFRVTYVNEEHRIPLAISRHDTYIAISSLAELLKEDYRFFLLVPSLGRDTHRLLVVPAAQAQAWGALPAHLKQLELGFDYFGGIKVPYLNHESSAPSFASESGALRARSKAMTDLLESGIIGGKVDTKASAALAKTLMTDPSAKQQLGLPQNASEAEVAAQIEKMMAGAFAAPDVRSLRPAIDDAMQELRNLGGAPKKPWWKLW
jgi:hypothetical protein